jgi:hypothetical protein
MAAALVGLMVGGAQAQVTTERSASILVFPRVISDGTRDTIIQITNTSNSMVHAHCFYVNGALTFPELPPDPILNPPRWVEIDFDIWLTKQQPTHWVVSRGRLVDATDPPCGSSAVKVVKSTAGLIGEIPEGFNNCDGAGIDPGRVPPVEEFFTGELKCIEVDQTGHPVSGNHLKGEATEVIRNVCDPEDGECEIDGEDCDSNDDCDLGNFDVAKANALGIIGNENNDGDGVLCLGGEPSDECPEGAEYDACPETWIANHFADGAFYPTRNDEDAAFVETTWTFVPCTQNFETQDLETVRINVLIWNEFENVFSFGFPITCWDEIELDELNTTVFDFDVLGTAFAQSRLQSAGQTRSGFLMYGTEEHETDDDWESFANVNYHVEGFRRGPDIITIPPEQLSPGAGLP